MILERSDLSGICAISLPSMRIRPEHGSTIRNKARVKELLPKSNKSEDK